MSALLIKDVFTLKLNVMITVNVPLILAVKKKDVNTYQSAAMITTLVLMTTAMMTLDVLT
jgi:hypothetical protein